MAKQRHRRNLDADPYIIQARCEMAAYVYLRPITWRLELVDDLSTFSDFIAVRTDLDGEERLRVFENDPSDWAYCFVVEGPPPSYHLCGWLWGHEVKQPHFKQLGQDRRPGFFVRHDQSNLRSFETLIDELIRRPLITGRAEDGRLPEFGRVPGRPEQDSPGPVRWVSKRFR